MQLSGRHVERYKDLCLQREYEDICGIYCRAIVILRVVPRFYMELPITIYVDA